MSRFGVALALVLLAAAAHAQPPTTTTRARGTVASALRSCLPGQTFAACTAALDAAHAPAIEGAHDGPMRRSVALRGSWLSVDMGADPHGRITRIRFEGTHTAGAARRRIFRAFDTLSRTSTRGSASPGVVCTGSGPAWFEDEDARAAQTPRVELTVDPIGELPDLGWPVDRIFLESSAEDQRVCLGVVDGAPDDTHDRFVAALARYLASTPL